PVPRSPTSSRTVAWRTSWRHHVLASSMRVGPATVTRATSPQATMPSARLTHDIPGSGSPWIRLPGPGIATVCTVSGAGVDACTVTQTSLSLARRRPDARTSEHECRCAYTVWTRKSEGGEVMQYLRAHWLPWPWADALAKRLLEAAAGWVA